MNLFTRCSRAALRAALFVFGTLLLLGTLLAAFVLGALALLWAVWRGSRPAVRAHVAPRSARSRRQASGQPAGEVIDLELRELR